MKSRYPLFLLALSLALGLLAGTCWTMRATAQVGPLLEVRVPAPGEVMEGEGAITVTLVLTAESVYGYQFVLTFDPTLLEAQAAGFDGTFVRPDLAPPGWDAAIDNALGTVRFAVTQLKPALPASGSGAIAWVRFAGKGGPTLPTTATVGVSDPRLGSRDGELTIPTVLPGAIRVLARAVITGRVELQGRTDWSGAIAAALPSTVSTTTDASGWYTLTVPAATYSVTVEMARYLDAWKVVAAARGTNTLAQVRLLAGDANDDEEIDIVDMSIIGDRFDKIVDPASERADINADGLVDILDITLAAGNYSRTSPVPWP